MNSLNTRATPTPYNDIWYESQVVKSYISATVFVRHLEKVIQPKRVVDVGCGRGAWLKAFGEASASELVGVDGVWNSQDRMIDSRIKFYGADLNKPFTIDESDFDLAVSLEVAEHLLPESAVSFVTSLTSLSNVVMFGAAYPGQGGTDHFNEQPHSYWGEIFGSLGFKPYDFFRPFLWGDMEVAYWYRQNTFLYVKQGTNTEVVLMRAGHQPVANMEWMNCIHPLMFEYQANLSDESPFRRYLFNPLYGLVLSFIPKRALPYARRLRRFLLKVTQNRGTHDFTNRSKT